LFVYLLAQIWWLLLLAFLLGALVGYVVWRACGLPRLRSEGATGRRELLDRIEALEKDNLRLTAEARNAATSAVKPANGAATTQPATQPSKEPAQKPAREPAAAAEPPPAPLVALPRIGFLDQPEGGKADNLKLIRGIGPRLEKVLNAMGVYHFAQIAGWTDEDLAVVDSRLGDFAGRAVRDKWIEQSRKMLERTRSADEQNESASS
jgi:predicted flap endonuclease-1-like 5' DNA nuclease